MQSSANLMETRARAIFRHALFKHYIDGFEPVGDQIEHWLKTHGGWFPDQQRDYGYGCLMPEADGPDVRSKDASQAVKDARLVMCALDGALRDTLDLDDGETLLESAQKWLEDMGVQK